MNEDRLWTLDNAEKVTLSSVTFYFIFDGLQKQED